MSKQGYIQYVGDYEKDMLKGVGIDINALNDAQLETVLIPVHAPENYYQDGEISSQFADYLHSQRLIQHGITGDLYIKAMRLAE
jgi:hypothetical protein